MASFERAKCKSELPLHQARSKEVMESLLTWGANIDAASLDHSTPLDFAILRLDKPEWGPENKIPLEVAIFLHQQGATLESGDTLDVALSHLARGQRKHTSTESMCAYLTCQHFLTGELQDWAQSWKSIRNQDEKKSSLIGKLEAASRTPERLDEKHNDKLLKPPFSTLVQGMLAEVKGNEKAATKFFTKALSEANENEQPMTNWLLGQIHLGKAQQVGFLKDQKADAKEEKVDYSKMANEIRLAVEKFAELKEIKPEILPSGPEELLRLALKLEKMIITSALPPEQQARLDRLQTASDLKKLQSEVKAFSGGDIEKLKVLENKQITHQALSQGEQKELADLQRQRLQVMQLVDLQSQAQKQKITPISSAEQKELAKLKSLESKKQPEKDKHLIPLQLEILTRIPPDAKLSAASHLEFARLIFNNFALMNLDRNSAMIRVGEHVQQARDKATEQDQQEVLNEVNQFLKFQTNLGRSPTEYGQAFAEIKAADVQEIQKKGLEEAAAVRAAIETEAKEKAAQAQRVAEMEAAKEKEAKERKEAESKVKHKPAGNEEKKSFYAGPSSTLFAAGNQAETQQDAKHKPKGPTG